MTGGILKAIANCAGSVHVCHSNPLVQEMLPLNLNLHHTHACLECIVCRDLCAVELRLETSMSLCYSGFPNQCVCVLLWL
ncbi:UNVERIFIED_CONTAM: hypothetical protein FKN15_003825 [Acipenser sinensis]